MALLLKVDSFLSSAQISCIRWYVLYIIDFLVFKKKKKLNVLQYIES